MLATAEFVALPMPEGCDVPVGALNHTGVMSKRNESCQLTRFATPYLLTQRVAVAPAACNLLTYPRFLSPHWLCKVEKVRNAGARLRCLVQASGLPRGGGDFCGGPWRLRLRR